MDKKVKVKYLIFFSLLLLVFVYSFFSPTSFLKVVFAADLPPVVNIQSPTDTGYFVTTDVALTVSGTSSDDGVIQATRWTDSGSDWAGSTVVAPSDDWTFTTNLLDVGVNELVVRTRDTIGNIGSSSMTIIRLPADGGLLGYAWAETIGWVSFSSLNCDPDGNLTSNDGLPGCPVYPSDVTVPYFYQTKIDPTTGHLSGYAWSENVGWISFNYTNTGYASLNPPAIGVQPDGYTFNSNCNISGTCTSAANCLACYNSSEELGSTGDGRRAVYGWARVLSLGNDGWIKLQSQISDGGVDYGVEYNLNTYEFSGFGWSGGPLPPETTGIGWLSFNCINDSSCVGSGYKTLAFLNLPPSTSFVAGSPSAPPLSELPCGPGNGFEGACASDCEKYPLIDWEFNDPEGLPQSKYHLIIDELSGSGSYDSGEVPSSVTQLKLNSSHLTMKYNTTYEITLNTWDSIGQESGEIVYAFTTDKHKYPDANFEWFIDEGSEDEEVKFWNNSVYFINSSDDPSASGICHPGYPGPCSFNWVSSDADLVDESLATTTAKFRDSGSSREIILEATDGDTYMCASSTSLDINLRLPTWTETR